MEWVDHFVNCVLASEHYGLSDEATREWLLELLNEAAFAVLLFDGVAAVDEVLDGYWAGLLVLDPWSAAASRLLTAP